VASPFSFFRRNQRFGMAILAIGAMFLFTFDIVISKWSGGGGGGGRGPVAVESSLGNLSSADIGDLQRNRRLANQFLTQAILKTRYPENILPFLLQRPDILNQALAQDLFSFGRSSTDEDVAVGWVLGQLGRKMGVVVDDIQVESFIESKTDRKLSSKMFKEIVKELGTSPKVLYDALRQELLAQQAWVTTIPRAPRTPIDFWRYYKNLNVRQRVDLTAVPVEQFLSKVADPSEAELRPYFEKHKNDFETLRDEVPVPGFKQPVKARLQYVVARFDAAEKEVAEKEPVTDADIEKYYEENKALLYPERPTGPTGDMPADKPATDSPASDGDKPVTPEVTPEADADKKPAAEKPATEKPATDKPEEPKPEEPKSEEKKPEEKKPADEKPAEEKKPDEPKPEAKPEAPATDDKPEAAPEKPAPEKKDGEQSSVTPRSSKLRVRLASFADEPAAETKPAEEKPAEEKPAEEKPAESKPAEEKPAEEKKPDEPKPEEKPATDKPEAGKPEDKKPEDGKPADPKPEEAKPLTDGLEIPAPAETIKYRPLDDDLKQEIREKLIAQRAAKRVAERLDKAADALLDAGRKLSEEYADPKLTADQQAALVLDGKDAMSAIAKAEGLEYGETALVSIPEFRELPGIGSSRESGSSDLMDQGENEGLIRSIFAGDQTRLPLRAVDPGTSNRYLFWKIQHSASHVAEFTEPGVKEQVTRAWKMEKARPLAIARAEELAKKVVAAGDKPMAEALGETTVTGDKEGLQLVVHNSPEFTWLRERSAPDPRGGATTPEVSVLPFVEKAGRKFMEAVFDGLDVGGTGVAANADDSVYYVVKVLERPFDPGTAREQLMTSPLFGRSTGMGGSPFDELARNESSRASFEYATAIEKKYAVKYRLRERDREGE
jgi:hypothetical protein